MSDDWHRLPTSLLPLVLGPAAKQDKSLRPFSIDRAARAALTPELLVDVLLLGEQDEELDDDDEEEEAVVCGRALVACARGLEANNALFSKAFELSRVFTYKWTVNLKFLPESVFQSKGLAAGLSALHFSLLAAFVAFRCACSWLCSCASRIRHSCILYWQF